MPSRGPVLKCDLDDVLLDLTPRWLNEYNMKYGDDVEVSDIKSWEMHKYVRPSVGMEIYDLLETPNLFAHASSVPLAMDGIKHVMDSGIEVLIVTAIPFGHSNIDVQKRIWLENSLGDYYDRENIYFCLRKDRVQGDFILDDAPHNIENEKDTLCKTIVFDAPYNKDVVSDHRMMDWSPQEVYKLINFMKSNYRYT